MQPHKIFAIELGWFSVHTFWVDSECNWIYMYIASKHFCVWLTAGRWRVISNGTTQLQWPVQRIPGHRHPREEDVHSLSQSHPDWRLYHYKYGAHSKTTPRQVGLCTIWLVGCSGLYHLACETCKLDKLTFLSKLHFYKRKWDWDQVWPCQSYMAPWYVLSLVKEFITSLIRLLIWKFLVLKIFNV